MKQKLYVNDVYLPYLDAQHRTQIFYGGSSSGKSFFLAQRVIKDVVQGRNYLVVRNVGSTLRNSVFNQLKKTILALGLESFFHVSGNMAITCKLNGKQILFSGLDDVEKLKSITPEVGILTDVWIEEATEVPYEAYKQLTKRLRGIDETGEAVKKRITFSFNPVMKTHWIFNEFFGNWDDTKNVYETDDLLILKTTYKDNKYLTEDDIRALESEKDPYYFAVYSLGEWGILGKVIFKNWHTEDLTKLIPTFDHIYNGLDFGFAEDPNALVRCHLDRKRKKIYVFEEMVQAGMYDDQLADELRHRIGTQYVTCDAAEPKAISDLCRRGIRAKSAVKGADSVNYGIRFLQGYEIIVDVRCQTLKNELQVYHWKEDKYGNTLQIPVDKDNHTIDALRYALEDVMLQDIGRAAKRL